MIAWAQALAAQGRLDEARHLAQRLREFRNPNAAEFFEACEAPAAAAQVASGASAPPFQCELPARQPGWRAYASGGGR
jgi:hypothetical protein